MALGNNNSFGGGPLIFLTPRNKDAKGEKVKPYFSVSRVGEDGKIAQTTEQVTSVSGDLVKADYKERDVKTKAGTTEKRKSVALYLKDSQASETYHVDISFSIAGRSLFNALATLGDSGSFEDVEISVYENRKGFEVFGLKQGGQQVKWKYNLDELPKADPIKDKKGNLIKNDYSEIDEFFLIEINKISEKLGGSKKKLEQESTKNTPEKTSAPTPSSNGNVDDASDIPF